jgi:hypothetical protein
MSFQPQLKSENGQPVFNVTQHVVMPLEGFVPSLAVQEDIVNKLIAAGVVKRNPKPEIAAAQAKQQRLEQPQDEEKEG